MKPAKDYYRNEYIRYGIKVPELIASDIMIAFAQDHLTEAIKELDEERKILIIKHGFPEVKGINKAIQILKDYKIK